MRVTIRRTPALLVAALASACASRPPAPGPTTPPGSAPDVLPLAKHAGTVFVFRFTPNADERALPIQRMDAQMREMFGVDITSASILSPLGADPDRPVVVSWSIVDPDQLAAVLASPQSPTRAVPFALRSQIVVPVVDPAHAADVLARATLDPNCARAQGEPDRWAAALAHLRDPEDRRAAERGGVLYFCRGDFNASVARFDAARRQVTWVAAIGWAALLAEAAGPVALDVDLAARLQRDGFFAARAGIYTTPADEARFYTATGLIRVEAAVSGTEEPLRGRLWRQGVKEVTATSRLVDSEPRLFEDVRIADRVSTWRLTSAGKTFFASLGLARTSDAEQLRKAIVAGLKPTGLFADGNALVQTVHEAGSGAFLLVHHFLWPHALAFAASVPPDAMPAIAAEWTGAGGMVEVDAAAGVVRAYADASR